MNLAQLIDPQWAQGGYPERWPRGRVPERFLRAPVTRTHKADEVAAPATAPRDAMRKQRCGRPGLAQQVRKVLAAADRPLKRVEVQRALRRRSTDIGSTIGRLLRLEHIDQVGEHRPYGYRLNKFGRDCLRLTVERHG